MAAPGPQPAGKAGALAAVELSRDSRSSSYDHVDVGLCCFDQQRALVAAPRAPAHAHPILYCAEPAEALAGVAAPAPLARAAGDDTADEGIPAPAPAPAAALLPHANGMALEDILAMIRHQRDREAELAPSPTHLEDAHGRASSGDEFVTPQMRLIVASWVVEVAEEFGLQQETLHLSVALLDRFLSATRGVPRGVLQLAAVAAVLVASKEQEVSHPSVGRLTAISANCFRSEDLLRMERILLDALDFRVAGPTAFTFLHLYAQALAVMAGGGGTGGGGGMGGGGGAARQQCAQLVGQAQQQQVQGHEEGAQQQSQQQQRRQQLAFGGAIAPAPAAAPAAAQAPPSSSSPSSLLCPSTSATYTAAYLVELAMLDYAMLAYPPSVLAAAALVVGALTAAESQQGQQAAAGPGADSAAAPPPLAPQQLAARLALVSGFPPAALQSCTAALLRLHRAAAWPESPAAAELLLPVRAKFGADAWCRAAHAAPLAALPAPLFRC